MDLFMEIGRKEGKGKQGNNKIANGMIDLGKNCERKLKANLVAECYSETKFVGQEAMPAS